MLTYLKKCKADKGQYEKLPQDAENPQKHNQEPKNSSEQQTEAPKSVKITYGTFDASH